MRRRGNGNFAHCYVIGIIRKITCEGEERSDTSGHSATPFRKVVIDFSHEGNDGLFKKHVAVFDASGDKLMGLLSDREVGDRVIVSFFPTCRFKNFNGVSRMYSCNMMTNIREYEEDRRAWWRTKGNKRGGTYYPKE